MVMRGIWKMQLFSMMINLIEAFFIAFFTAHYFSIKNKTLYISIITIILSCLLNIAQFLVINNGLWLSVFIILIVIISLCIWTKRFSFDYIYISVLYHISIVMMTTLSFVIVDFLTQPLEISNNLFQILFCSLAKIGQIGLTFIILKKQIRISTSLDLKHWKSVILIDSCLMIGTVLSAYVLVEAQVSEEMYKVLLVIFIILIFLFRNTITKIENLNLEKINAVRLEEQNRFTEKQLSMMKYMKNEIDATNHKMNYLLFQLRRAIEKQQTDEMLELIDNYTQKTLKNRLLLDTGNSVFDWFVSLKINELVTSKRNVQTAISMSKNVLYNDIAFVNSIVNLLDYFKNCDTLHISIIEYSDLLRIQIIFRDGKVDLNELENYINDTFLDKERSIKDDFLEKGITLVINMEKYYAGFHN